MKINIIHIILSCAAMALASPVLHARNDLDGTPENVMTFSTYLARVGKHNLGYMAGKLDVDIAEADVTEAGVRPDPSLEFEGCGESYTLGLAYSLELGKRHARVEYAKSLMELEKTALEQNFRQLQAEAADLFTDAILQRELLKAKKEACSYMFQLSQSDSLRYISGEITEIEYRQSALEAVSLLAEVFAQEAAFRSSLVELNMLMGVAADTLNIPDGNWDSLDRNFSLDTLLETGMNNNLQLTEAARNADVSAKAYRLVKAERRPDIGLSLSYERDWSSIRPHIQYAKVGVSVPLPFSSINKGALRSAEYRMEQSSIMEREAQLRVRGKITQAWYAFEAERKKVAQYRSGVLDQARRVLEGTTYMYRRGETGILDVLIAQRSYNQVTQDFLETMKSYVSALVALEKSCGIWDIQF